MSLVNLAHACSHLQNASLARLGLTSIPYTKLHLQVALLLQRQGLLSTVDIAGPTPPLTRLPQSVQADHKRIPSDKETVPRERLLAQLVRYRSRLQAHAARSPQGQSEEQIRDAVVFRAEQLAQLHQYTSEDSEWALSHAHRSSDDILENGVDLEVMGLTVEDQPLHSVSQTIIPSESIITQENRASRRLWLGMKYWNGEPVLRKARMISKPSKRMWLNTLDLARVIRGSQAGEVKGLTRIGEIMAISTDKGIMEARECVERRIGGQPLARFY